MIAVGASGLGWNGKVASASAFLALENTLTKSSVHEIVERAGVEVSREYNG